MVNPATATKRTMMRNFLHMHLHSSACMHLNKCDNRLIESTLQASNVKTARKKTPTCLIDPSYHSSQRRTSVPFPDLLLEMPDASHLQTPPPLQQIPVEVPN
jgi:hypothetical protein